MKIIEEESVDWEPLRIQFMPAVPVADADSLARDVRAWFETNATKDPSDCDLRYWHVSTNETGVVEAFAEHLTMKSLQRLSRHVAKRHRDIDRMIIGHAPKDEPKQGRSIGSLSGRLKSNWRGLPSQSMRSQLPSHQSLSVSSLSSSR